MYFRLFYHCCLAYSLLSSFLSLQDWASYAALCAEDFTCFEPETSGRVVEGLAFHKHFFDYGNSLKAAGDVPVTCTMSNVVV